MNEIADNHYIQTNRKNSKCEGFKLYEARDK